MKVRLCYTLQIPDRYRRAINHHYGEAGLASREAVRRWIMSYGSSADADIEYELTESEQRKGN